MRKLLTQRKTQARFGESPSTGEVLHAHGQIDAHARVTVYIEVITS